MGNYLDFELLIYRDGEGYKARVLNAPAGQASVTFAPPFSGQEAKSFPLRTGGPKRSIGSPEVQAAKAFGERLFRAAFSEEVRDCLRSSLTFAADSEFGLRISLRLDEVPELADLPWEYLWDPRHHQFLIFSSIAPVVIVRYLQVPEIIEPLRVSPPLRILVMISSPIGLEPLEGEREWESLNKALDGLTRLGLIKLKRLEKPTLMDLRREVRQEKYHVFHFIGHGVFDEYSKDGFLVLEDDHRMPHLVSGQDIAIQLHDRKSLRLAILNSCEGARADLTDSFVGVAQSLVQRGIPAVIAMQFEISDQAAITFASEFYQALAERAPIDAALTEGRLAIHAQGNKLEWGTPVLYLRAPDGRIFDIDPPLEQEPARATEPKTILPNKGLTPESEPVARAAKIPYPTSFERTDIGEWEQVVVATQMLTPHLEISPISTTEGLQRLKVSVYLESTSKGMDTLEEGQPEQKRFEVDVWLSVEEPFEISGPAVTRLAVLKGQELSERVEFTVTQNFQAGKQSSLFTALFSYRGRSCGRVTRIVPLTVVPREMPDLPVTTTTIQIDATAVRPDLSVHIIVSGIEERLFDCLIQTPLLPEYRDGGTESWRLSSLATEFVTEKMSRFTAKNSTPFARTAALRGAGIQFFEASPPLFQKVLWELIDAGSPLRTISIISEEPSIPWELMVPTRNGDEDREALGVTYLISRWTARNHILPPQTIPLQDAYVVAPKDSLLPHAEQEAAIILQYFSAERIDPAEIDTLDRSLARHGKTLIHFICHSRRGADSQILLLEKGEELSPSYLRAMRGLKAAFRTAKPLVFLNASEAGRQEPVLVGAGGFAEAFMALGASGVIAPLWSVKDSIAHEVAREFYQRITQEPNIPFSEILRDLRKKSYVGGEDSYAAYTFYGDPLARRAPAPPDHSSRVPADVT